MEISPNSSPKFDHNTAMVTALLLPVARMLSVTTEVDAKLALRALQGATTAEREGAYTAYRAAVDRKEAAAGDLQRLCDLAQRCQ